MLRLYNTLTRQVEPFAPIDPALVRIYSCGPTVYRYIHIGNLRTFLMADWLKRTLVYLGYPVRHVKNITDVGHMRVELLDQGEDKLIAQARQEGKTSAEIAAFYTAAFLADEARMRILPADVFPRATEHIPDMLTIIAGLERAGLAYFAGGNVYFDIARFPGYGKLSGNQIAGLLEGVRDTADPNKRNPEDFALWKAAEPGRELAWDSPWGRGFPGWHIECSAMSLRHLGRKFDIHTGGVDNIFPHHEGEIAQSEGYTGARFVNYWLHAQHLLADGLKMAKSTGNAYTLSDIEARGFEPMALRLLFANVHYRSRINFTFSSLRAAQTALGRLRARVQRLMESADGAAIDDAAQEHWRTRFVTAISNDLNLPQALACVWDLLHQRGPALGSAQQRALLLDFDRVLGLGLAEDQSAVSSVDVRAKQALPHISLPQISLPASPKGLQSDIAGFVSAREVLRAEQRYAEADAVRAQIRASGYLVRDTATGPQVLARAPEEEFGSISRPNDVASQLEAPDHYEFSVNLLAHDSRADLERCVASIARQAGAHSIEIVIVDNGSTDDTVDYLRQLVRSGLHGATGVAISLTVLFADHNMGFAAGRNATMRASRGQYLVLLDTSIELTGDLWTPLAAVLADPQVGIVGPYGLITRDLKEFEISAGPAVDAVEGYLMAFRRVLLRETGWFEEKFRFYRLLDIYQSFMVKTAGYEVLAMPELAAILHQHPHREWESLSEFERATKSKKNYDIFKRRWHHGQSLLAVNSVPGERWFGHDHNHHLGANHTHAPEELPAAGQLHSHRHQHWLDHDHEHPHRHS